MRRTLLTFGVLLRDCCGHGERDLAVVVGTMAGMRAARATEVEAAAASSPLRAIIGPMCWLGARPAWRLFMRAVALAWSRPHPLSTHHSSPMHDGPTQLDARVQLGARGRPPGRSQPRAPPLCPMRANSRFRTSAIHELRPRRTFSRKCVLRHDRCTIASPGGSASTQRAVRCRRRAKVKLHAFHQPAVFCPCEGCGWGAQRPSGSGPAARNAASRAGHSTGSLTGVASTTAVLPACCQWGKSRHVSQAGHRPCHGIVRQARAACARGAWCSTRASAAARYSADVDCACSGSAVSAHAACAVQVNRLQ